MSKPILTKEERIEYDSLCMELHEAYEDQWKDIDIDIPVTDARYDEIVRARIARFDAAIDAYNVFVRKVRNLA